MQTSIQLKSGKFKSNEFITKNRQKNQIKFFHEFLQQTFDFSVIFKSRI